MTLSIDHIVIRVRDLEQTIADYVELGFTVQRGGTHADGATHNALIGFQDGSYFELIAFLRDAPEHRWWDADNRAGDGLVDFALLPESVKTVVDAARQRGLSYEGPIAGGRVRPDGERLAWQLGKPATPDLPFLCGDVTPRHLRVAEGEVRFHRNGARGISGLNVAVRDLDASVSRYRALLGEPLQVHRSALPGHGVWFATLSIGATTLTLLSPSGTASGTGLAKELEERLASRGEGVFGVVLNGPQGASPHLLPLGLTHGAGLEVLPTVNAEPARS
ncbi:MAG: VOC family protein [Paraburkholderia sp.]|jgi:catechol 2,3-dioxygenase-like lactoylglutathione lyase family enzyme|uniref:VOC family protein n=1 Tax=Burkholderiaceae TaxID=119060 RepID=UPI0010F6143C|nr:VOC family protein [Burkholderia sp. 4M9327F10]